jgi:hypothetical protein
MFVPTAVLSIVFTIYSLLLTISGQQALLRRVLSLNVAPSVDIGSLTAFVVDFSSTHRTGLQK